MAAWAGYVGMWVAASFLGVQVWALARKVAASRRRKHDARRLVVEVEAVLQREASR